MLNRGYAYTSCIRYEERGWSVLGWLARRYSHSSAEAWQRRLEEGEVTVDGVVASGGEVLRAGQRVVWQRPAWVEANVPLGFEVLFEDADLLAVNKPGGLPTLPGGGFLENTLLRLVQRRSPEANPVHRLGRGTSGIVLFAKTAQAAAGLTADWDTARVRKIYRALAQGSAERDSYEILTPIGRVAHPRLGTVWAASEGGKASKSVAKVIARSGGWAMAGGTTTFEVALFSGRPHQIRIHLASIGHPLVGDPLYGVGGRPLEGLPGLPGDGGYRLHARLLGFRHPVSGEAIEVEAALPNGWEGGGLQT